MTDKKVYQNAINMFDDAIEEFKKTYKKIKWGEVYGRKKRLLWSLRLI
jgi:hypothetical protein